MSEAHKGNFPTQETKQKMSETHKRNVEIKLSAYKKTTVAESFTVPGMIFRRQ